MVTVNLDKLNELERAFSDRIRADKSVIAFFHLTGKIERLTAELQNEEASNELQNC